MLVVDVDDDDDGNDDGSDDGGSFFAAASITFFMPFRRYNEKAFKSSNLCVNEILCVHAINRATSRQSKACR